MDDITYEILYILSKEKKFTPLKLYSYLKKKKQYTKSYQNLHKHLSILIKSNVLFKERGNYFLNSSWIENEIFKLEKIKNSLMDKNEPKYKDSRISINQFNTLEEVNSFWIETIKEKINAEKSIYKVFWEGPNTWWTFTHLMEENHYLDFLNQRKIQSFFLIKKSNELNKQAKNYYNSKGTKCIIRNEDDEVYLHRGVFGDFIIETQYPKEINSFFDEIYSQKENTFIENVQKISEFNKEFIVKVFKDKEMAKHYKEKYLKLLSFN